jgi:hypothetical protein
MAACDPDAPDEDEDHVDYPCAHCHWQHRNCSDDQENQRAESRVAYESSDHRYYVEDAEDMCREVIVVSHLTEYQDYCFDGPVGGCASVETYETFRGDWYECGWSS